MSDSFATPWTVARQVALPMGFPRLAYWSGLPFPSPGNLPEPGIELASSALAGKFFTTSATWESQVYNSCAEGHTALHGPRLRKGYSPFPTRRSSDLEIATHSSILAWRIPWTEESGGL